MTEAVCHSTSLWPNIVQMLYKCFVSCAGHSYRNIDQVVHAGEHNVYVNRKGKICH